MIAPEDQIKDPEHLLENFSLPVHMSLVRPILWLGAERRFATFNALVTLMVIQLLGWKIIPTLFCIGVASLVHLVCVWAAKRDPQLMAAYVRSRFYRDYYPARASRTAAPRRIDYRERKR